MTAINFNNKSLIFPQIVTEKGRTTSRQLLGTSNNGEHVTSEVKITETVQNRSELDRVSKFEAKSRQAMLKLSTPGPKGMHLLDNSQQAELRRLIADLRNDAASLNAELTVCRVDVDCLVVPVDLTLDANTADRLRQHVQGMLATMRALLTQPDANMSTTQRYSAARSQYYACQHLMRWVTGVNADLVRAAIDEASEKCVDTKSGGVTATPCLDAAIAIFDPVAIDSIPTFAEMAA